MDMRLYLDEIYDSLDHRLFEKNHVFEGQEWFFTELFNVKSSNKKYK